MKKHNNLPTRQELSEAIRALWENYFIAKEDCVRQHIHQHILALQANFREKRYKGRRAAL